MTFFQNYWNWLQTVLTGFIGAKTFALAGTLSPLLATLATIYVMLWGYFQLIGKIEEPLLEGIKRILTIAVILGLAVQLWLYNAAIVEFFFKGPFALAAFIAGAPPLALIDTLWTQGSKVAELFWANAGVWSGDFGSYFAAILVWLITGLLCVYTMFLLILSQIALTVLLAIGPIFLAMLFLDSTKRFFEAWIAQLANYGLIAILAVTVASLLLSLCVTFANQTVGVGSDIKVQDAGQFLITIVLVFLMMRQVPAMAAGLASGVALATGNIISRAVTSGLGSARKSARGMYDAMTGAGTSRYDPMSRKGGYYTALGAGKLAQATWRAGTAPFRRGNTVSPSGGGGAPRTGAASRGAPRLPPKK